MTIAFWVMLTVTVIVISLNVFNFIRKRHSKSANVGNETQSHAQWDYQSYLERYAPSKKKEIDRAIETLNDPTSVHPEYPGRFQFEKQDEEIDSNYRTLDHSRPCLTVIASGGDGDHDADVQAIIHEETGSSDGSGNIKIKPPLC